MAEIEDTLTPEAEKGVEVEWLDYGYIEKCTDAKRIKAILSVLRSGKEGSYPDVSAICAYRMMMLTIFSLFAVGTICGESIVSSSP
jgi:hypothetical protein